MEREQYSVFVQTDLRSRVVAVNSSAFVGVGWGVLVDEGVGDRYHHAQGNYFEGGLYTEDGIPRYKLEDGHPVERTDAEIEADRVPILEAQIREQRNKLLSESDWTQIPDNPLSQSERESWATYRKQLRDIPEQTGFPTNITWPERWS